VFFDNAIDLRQFIRPEPAVSRQPYRGQPNFYLRIIARDMHMHMHRFRLLSATKIFTEYPFSLRIVGIFLSMHFDTPLATVN